MRLILDVGRCDHSAKHAVNQGKTIAAVSDVDMEAGYGTLLACAEGLAERPDAEQAAKTATTALDDAYYAGVHAVSGHQALEEALNAANTAVHTGGGRGRAAVIAALVLQGRRWLAGHAGNVRVWRFRDLQVKQLTHDHVVPRALRRTEVTRACGFADALGAEYSEGDLKEGDVFLLTSPGVHEVLDGPAVLSVLQSDSTAQQMAETLAERAVAHTPAYVGVCVARVEKLPTEAASAHESPALPVIELPEPDTEVDGFVIGKLILKNRRFRLYKAEDRESDKPVALRFPDSRSAESAQSFLREERLARRVAGPFMLRPVPIRPARRTAVYSVLEYRAVETLAKRIRRKHGLPLAEAVRLGEQLLAALEALHGQGMLHRDINARSLLYDKQNRGLCMPGLGTDGCDAPEGDERKLRSNTLSYWAPELFDGSPAGERTDIYAAGVTIYRMLTEKYPYGRIRSRADWREPREYAPLGRYRERLPGGLDDVLERACAVDPARRYAAVAQFAAALDAARLSAPPRPAPVFLSAGSSDTTGTHRPWWFAAALVAGLLAYLYFALR